MRNRVRSLACVMLVSLAGLSAGCIDAIWTGTSEGIIAGISSVIEDLIVNAAPAAEE